MGAGYTAPTYKCVARVLWCSLSGICYICGISYIFVVGISLGGFFGGIRPKTKNIVWVGLSPAPGSVNLILVLNLEKQKDWA